MLIANPPPGETLDREFADYQMARRYAERLADENGWMIADQVEAGR
ncbi:MAG: hypothetical protein R3E02_01880 [Blastomonas sp.]